MRSDIVRLAASLPGALNIMLAGAVFTVLLVNVTDSWLPGHFVDGLRHFDAAPRAASSGDFCRFILAGVFLYVLSMSACGVAIAAALIAAIRRVWQLAER